MSRSSDGKTYADRKKRGGGEQAEKTFVEYAKQHNISIERYGFDDSKLPNFYKIPPFVRHTPDYVGTRKGKPLLIECKAGGTDAYVNLKHKDVDALHLWDQMSLGCVYLFINDSIKKKVSLQLFGPIYDDLSSYKSAVWHDEDKDVHYYRVPKTMFEWEPK